MNHPSVGRHGLGPEVVGQRIVVRRLLRGETGPSGGPAFTDLLGICLAWADGVCVVQPESGPPVQIAIGDIVSGKPVPPRPSVRHRISPLAAERRALALWPGLETEQVGEWTLRHSPTSTVKRANSALAIGPSGVPDDRDAVLRFYGARGLRPLAAVLPDSAEEAHFAAASWVPWSGPDALFLVAGVARARRAAAALLAERTSGEPLPEATYEPLGPAADTPTTDRTEVVGVRLGEHARGIAAYAEDWVGFREIEVDAAHRRRGLGLALMAELLDWGAERGATTAYLQVEADNAPALGLYEALGFATHHAYRYLAAPQ